MLKFIAGVVICVSMLFIVLFLCYSISYFITAGHYNAKLKAIGELHRIAREDGQCEKSE